MNILVINCGSSSLKYSVWDSAGLNPVVSGKHERLGKGGQGQTHQQALQSVLDEVASVDIAAVGYRVVHGGARYTQATEITEAVIAEIEARIPDAPMHNPYALAAIKALSTARDDLLHVAVFDTSFHTSMPRRATAYAIEAATAEKYGIRRFGFHGISHAYVAKRAAASLQRDVADLRLVTLHLGNGASACAVEYGHSTETSMGNTPLEGLVMGTRSGDVDAGVLLSLLRSGDFDAAALDDLLNHRSGLAGLSGISNDLREIEDAAEQGDGNARRAINVFAHRARKYIGAYAAAMGGVDAVVFTGGIGENSSTMRKRILQRLEFLGLHLDDDRNSDVKVDDATDSAVISTAHSRVDAIVIKTNEAKMIAQQTEALASKRRHARQLQTVPAIPIAVSGRHMHLTEATFKALFGEQAEPTHYLDLSQPGQYACEEKVSLIGPRNRIEGVRLLGPLRSVDQVEISRTDEFRLGIDAPVRDSGKVAGSAPITLEGPAGQVKLNEGLICARRHIHMHPDDAESFSVVDKQEVSVAVQGGERDLVFGDVLVRVSEKYKLEMHIDTDEGNAAELSKGAEGGLVYENIDAATALILP